MFMLRGYSYSLYRIHVDAPPGGIWSEGPQCVLPNSTHSAKFQQRHLRHYEYSRCVWLGKLNSIAQPFWRVSRYACYEIHVEACQKSGKYMQIILSV